MTTKTHEWIAQDSDSETYEVNGKFYKVAWGYDKATGNECYVMEWTGEETAPEALPPGTHEDWETITGFDFEILEDGSPDWDAYVDMTNEILNSL